MWDPCEHLGESEQAEGADLRQMVLVGDWEGLTEACWLWLSK